MDNITIVSPLKPDEWVASWENKVVDESEKKTNLNFSSDYFSGQMKDNNEFVIGFHKAFESKSLSMDEYFYGSVKDDEAGCKISGKYSKKTSVKVYLVIGMALFMSVTCISLWKGQTETLFVGAALFLIFLAMFFVKPKKEREIIKEFLIKISSDETFKGKVSTRSQRKRSMREKATVRIEDDI